MSVELTLQQTKASGPLMPTTLAPALERIAKGPRGPRPRPAIFGRHLRLSLGLAVDDGACAEVTLTFEGQGTRLRGSARGPSAVLLQWVFHTLAAAMKCTLHDSGEGELVTPTPDAYLTEAIAYLEAYEREVGVLRDRRGAGVDLDDDGSPSPDGYELLTWLAREEQIALRDAEGDRAKLATLGASLPMRDVNALYELLLDSDEIDDVFVSEMELSALLDRFRARIAPRR